MRIMLGWTFAERLAVRYSTKWRQRRARELHKWFMREVNGSGLRCAFDYGPSQEDMQLLSDIDAECRADVTAFQRRVNGFMELHDFLDALRNHTVWHPNPHASLLRTASTINRSVEASMLTYCKLMFEAFTAYIQAIRTCPPGSNDILKAADTIAAIINPHEWQSAGIYTPNPTRASDLGIRTYLEALLRTDRLMG